MALRNRQLPGRCCPAHHPPEATRVHVVPPFNLLGGPLLVLRTGTPNFCFSFSSFLFAAQDLLLYSTPAFLKESLVVGCTCLHFAHHVLHCLPARGH